METEDYLLNTLIQFHAYNNTTEEIQSHELFKQLSPYPNQITPIRYPMASYTISRYNSTIHDLIYTNMLAIVPNIDIGIHKGTYSSQDLAEWIRLTKEYYGNLHQTFQSKCDYQLAKLNRIENQKNKCASLNIARLDKLPSDIILHIREYLLPESRIDELLATYPDFDEDLQRLTVKSLRKLYINGIYNPYFLHFTSSGLNRNRIKCIRPALHLNMTFKNKFFCANEMKRVFESYRNAVPVTPEDYIFFQKKALKILQTIVYFTYHQPRK
jgi:hypothetical protein